MQAEWGVETSDEDQTPGAHSQDSDTNPAHRQSGAGAHSIYDILSTLFSMQSGGGVGQRTISLGGISGRDLGQLSNLPNIGGFTLYEAEDDDEEEEEYDGDDYYYYSSYGAHQWQQWYPPHKEPQTAGLDLLASGDFGQIAVKDRTRRNNVNVTKRLLTRMAEPPIKPYKEDLSSNLVPNTNGTAVASFGANVYSGQYSADSSFYYTCSQGNTVSSGQNTCLLLPRKIFACMYSIRLTLPIQLPQSEQSQEFRPRCH
ncbi:hypothetical protein AX17_000883 [Amanita inopinata Kibby_2008]|nr:hypothetical protein AX17_000883 [Amanita inopinata Kibby_2008]